MRVSAKYFAGKHPLDMDREERARFVRCLIYESTEDRIQMERMKSLGPLAALLR